MTDKDIRELEVPPDAQEQGGAEVLRAFVVDRALSISLQRAFDEPGTWGLLLADVAKHVARIYAQETGIDADDALADIREAFDDELDRPSEDDDDDDDSATH